MSIKSSQISVIICTYMRPDALQVALRSFSNQTVSPLEIIIVDGSTDTDTAVLVASFPYLNLQYYSVNPDQRGLTKQRNFGLSKVSHTAEIVAFIDDDVELYPDYFERLQEAFLSDAAIVGVGGVAVNEMYWKKNTQQLKPSARYYLWEDYVFDASLRNRMRHFFGLESHLPPGCMPEYGHGRTYSYPLTGKIYEVDVFMGYSMAFRASLFTTLRFSTYFEGYGLYEDADFCIRAQKLGKIVVATTVLLNHFSAPSGRPNAYKYGKMVVRNGWYVWRQKYPNPSSMARFKWNCITLLLACIRGTNVFTETQKMQALTDCLGRWVGWFSLVFNPPKIQNQ